MDANGAVVARTRRPGGRAPWRIRAAILVVVIGALAIPFSVVPASAQSGGSAPPVKVGMITALTGPIASNPEVKDALDASIAAFNKRGGVGDEPRQDSKPTSATRRGDANGEVDVRTPDGRRRRRRDAQRPHVQQPGRGGRRPRGRRDPAYRHRRDRHLRVRSRVSRIRSRPGSSRPTSAPRSGSSRTSNTKICLMRTDAPTGATFKGFLTPSFTAIGVDIICDVAGRDRCHRLRALHRAAPAARTPTRC